MKKLITGFALVLVLFAGSAFFLIPANLVVYNAAVVPSTAEGVFRVVSRDTSWQNWLPCNMAKDADLQSFEFSLSGIKYNAVDINVMKNGQTIPTRISLLQVSPDSLAIQWQAFVKSSYNPVKRFRQYEQFKELKQCIDTSLLYLKDFVSQTRNIYGFDIRHTTLTDSALVSIKKVTNEYPTNEMVYAAVDKLRLYISSQDAKETNFPMLNVSRNNDSTYLTMVAIPTNKRLAGTQDIAYKRLIQLKDKILYTEVKGGQQNIDRAFSAISEYMNDRRLAAPVIPFQLLVTDRRKIKDPNQWITRIYYPII